MIEYKTVENHPIIVGECYQTRDGRKAFISFIKENWAAGIIVGMYGDDDWTNNGYSICAEEPSDRDLMRPYPSKKIEVTNKMAQAAYHVYGKEWDKMPVEKMKAALEAVFAVIEPKGVQINEGDRILVKGTEKDVVMAFGEYVKLTSKPDSCIKEPERQEVVIDIQKHEELSRRAWEEYKQSAPSILPDDIFNSFPPELPIMDKPESDNDGWIEHNGSNEAPNLPINTILELRFKHHSDNDIGKITEPWIWSNIIAYRIIQEPKYGKDPIIEAHNAQLEYNNHLKKVMAELQEPKEECYCKDPEAAYIEINNMKDMQCTSCGEKVMPPEKEKIPTLLEFVSDLDVEEQLNPLIVIWRFSKYLEKYMKEKD